MPAAVADERILWKVAASCSVTLQDQYGEPVAAVGAVTVDIVNAIGTVIATGRATTQDSPAIVGVYRVALTATETASLDLFTLTWKDGGVARKTTYVEMVGGFYFGIQELRDAESSLSNRTVYSDDVLKSFRRAAEEEAERVSGSSFVPRYRRTVVKSTGQSQLVLEDAPIRVVREVAPALQGAYSATDITGMTVREYGVIEMATNWFPAGMVTVGYEYGHNRPPRDVKNMAMRRARYLANLNKSPSNDRQARLIIEPDTGRTLQFSAASAYRTGDDEVDSVYARFGIRSPAIG